MQDAEDRFARSTFDDLGRLIRLERFADDPVNAGAHLLQRSEFHYDKNSRKTTDIAFSDAKNPASAQITH